MAALGVVGVTGACAGDPASPGAERRDSAGVEIVVTAAPLSTDRERWQLDSVARWEPSGTGPEYEFARVADATVLSDGTVVVLNAGTHEVRFYDVEGRLLHRVGREGEGPGDFQRLANVAEFRGDSVLVFDSWLRRATIFDRAGALGRIMTLASELQVEELHPVGAEDLVAKTWSLEEFYEAEGAYRGSYLLLGVDAEGRVVDSIAHFAGWSGFKVNREDGGYSDFSPLFVYDGHVAANDHGIVTSSAEWPEFIRYSADGTPRQVVRAPSLSVPLGRAEIEAERAWMDRPEAPAEYRRTVQELPAPERRPAHGDLLLDARGHVWAARYWSPRLEADEPVVWDVFDDAGEWSTTLSTPGRFTVFEIGDDYVLGARRDELDVERIQILGLHRGRSGPGSGVIP